DQVYPLTYEGQRQFTADLVAMLNRHKNVTGLFWWFPEANEYGLDWATQRVTDEWYNASLFDNATGRALPALDELEKFLVNDDANVPIVEVSPDFQHWYTLDGRFTTKPSMSGVYIRGHEKIVVK
ncbi:MAG: glycosyl hydrolase 53 family protein, partial [Prevotella sp.]|nr:glycosyl hydrolase 53 family protein [Prevotella sp.]